MTSYGKTPFRGLFTEGNLPIVKYYPRITTLATGAITDSTGDAPTARKIKSVKFSIEDDADDELQTNENGTVVGFIDKMSFDKLDFELIIQADSKANALAEVTLPAKYSPFEFTDVFGNDHAFMNGIWVYRKGGKLEASQGADEDVKISIPLWRFYKPDGTLVDQTVATGILKRIS